MKRILSVLFLVFFFRSAWAIDLVSQPEFSLKLKGYYKNLQFNTHRQTTGYFVEANLNRLRTEWDSKLLKVFSAKVVWDNELIFGNFVQSEAFQSRQLLRDQPYGDLEYEIAQSRHVFYGQNLYRAYGELSLDKINLRVGRQKIEWGIMRLFSPGDLFHPLPIFDVEKSERVGATAANLTLTPASEFKINVVYAFDSNADKSRLAGRVTKTYGHFDLSAFGGKFLRDSLVGFDFSGDVLKAGVRGEFYFNNTDVGDNFIQGSLGIDYGFANTFYLALEHFYNGQGTNDALTASLFLPSAAQIRSVHKNFSGLQMKYDLTPLWTTSLMTILDWNGGSIFINPETKYSVKEWWDVSVGAHFPIGSSSGEFTPVPNLYYLQSQWFF